MSLINDALKQANKAPRRNPPPTPPLGNLQPVDRAGGGGSSFLIPGLLIAVLLMAGIFFVLWWRSSKATTMAGNLPAPVTAPMVTATPAKPAPVAPVAAPTPKPAPTAANSGMVPTKFGIKISTNLVVRTNAVKPAVADVSALTVASATSTNPETVTPSPAPATVTATTEPTTSTVASLPPTTVTTTTTSTSISPSTAPEPTPPAVVTTAPVAPVEAPKVVPPPPPAKPQFPTVKLQGIFYRTTSPSVLINGRTLRTGDKVEGVKVIKIERESVTLEWGGETKVLSMDQ